MSSLQARKDEILAKKAKLAELKRQRELRQKEFSNTRQSIGESTELIAPAPSRATSRADLDNLISSLVDRPGTGSPRAHGSPARGSRPTSIVSGGHIESSPARGDGLSPAPSQQAPPQNLSFAPLTTVYDTPAAAKPEYITYSKGVQTSEQWTQSADAGASRSGSEDEGSPTRSRKRLSRRERERDEELRQNLRKEIEEELRALQLEEITAPTNGKENFPARTLTHDELNAVQGSDDFLEFIERSSKVIERALEEEYDVLADYAVRGLDTLDEDDDDEPGTKGRKGRRIKQVQQYQDEKLTKRRMLSDLDFSPKYPELLLASYTKAANSPQSAPGLALIWNAHMPSRPEYTFTAPSDILCTRFSPFHPSLILGGTYSGQVCIWDTRHRSPTNSPAQRTPLAGERGGHAHPIYSLSVVGTQNASSIISVSTDGTLCAWSFDMLSKPQEHLSLLSPPGRSRTEDLAPTCISFPRADPTSLLAGTEEGSLVPIHRYDRAGAKAGVDARLVYRGHTAPVTGIDFHPSRGRTDVSDLVLSSGLDWSVKLWRARPAATSLASATGLQIEKPLLDISREDPVYDVKWHPHRASVFGTVDGKGALDVFDLCVDGEAPVASAQPSHTEGDVYGVKSLNRLAWEQTEGKRVAVGGLDGVVTVFEVGNGIGGVGGEDAAGLKRMVGRLDRK